MTDYRKMYYLLCAEVSKAIDALPRTEDNAAGLEMLQKALYEAEEIYIDTSLDEDE